MAQDTPWQPEPSRLPYVSASWLDDRTRPDYAPDTIWLRHRLQRRHMRESAPPPSRSRRWLRRLMGR